MNQREPKPVRPNYWLDEEPGGDIVNYGRVRKRDTGKVRLKRDNRRRFRQVERAAVQLDQQSLASRCARCDLAYHPRCLFC